jgi:uncharacterized HAD superfamily protein
MNIGIDIDDTITDINDEMFRRAKEYDKTLRNKGIIYPERFYAAQVFDWNEEEKEYYLKNIRKDVVLNAHPREGVIDILKEFKNLGYKIYIITSRSKRYYESPYQDTYDWLVKENIPFDKLIVSALDKGLVCKNENIDIFIDDQVKNCLLVKNQGIKTLLFDIGIPQKGIEQFETVKNWNEVRNRVLN